MSGYTEAALFEITDELLARHMHWRCTSGFGGLRYEHGS